MEIKANLKKLVDGRSTYTFTFCTSTQQCNRYNSEPYYQPTSTPSYVTFTNPSLYSSQMFILSTRN